jgi:primosomal protein N' (replication factor Y)
VVSVVPDVRGVTRQFDYLVPEAMAERVRVGTQVRVELHGRRVGGWVTAVGVRPPEGVTLKPLAKVRGWGPPESVVEVARWAAWRWAGPASALLGTASALRAVPELPPPPAPPSVVPSPATWVGAMAAEAMGRGGVQVLRLPPCADQAAVALAASQAGPVLVVAPTQAHATAVGGALRRAGLPTATLPTGWALARTGRACVVGARAAAWAPIARPCAVVVLDEHDETLQEERAPTWNARDVAVERARRLGVPCLLVSPVPSPETLQMGELATPPRGAERDGWPIVDVIDRRDEDPVRGGPISEHLGEVLRSAERVVCVLNRKGRSRLLACADCGTLARCDECGAAVGQAEGGSLVCAGCGAERPAVCLACHHGRFKNLRAGVTRMREELEALARRPVVEVSGPPDGEALVDAGVFIGTEAVLHRVRTASVVVFLDFDQELLAPRMRAAQEAAALLVRAARLVGPRAGGGRVMVQTRLPDHDVVRAALLADPSRMAEHEIEQRRVLGQPPFSAQAEVSGASAEEFMERLGSPSGVAVLGPVDGRWLVRARDHATLGDALAAVERPPGRLRVAVDPPRV